MPDYVAGYTEGGGGSGGGTTPSGVFYEKTAVFSAGENCVVNLIEDKDHIVEVFKQESLSSDTIDIYTFSSDEFNADSRFVYLNGSAGLKTQEVFSMSKPDFYFAKQIDVDDYKDIVSIDSMEV